ncbi:MAG TPA: molybdopterin-dependent oxidoreductase, partial [bacterium]
ALARAGRAPSLAIAVPECDSLGLALLGPRPLDEAFFEAGRGGIDTLVVLENDLFRRADRARVAALLDAVPNVVTIDHTLHGTAAASDLLLPAATFAECTGTFVSGEGRAQRFFAAMPPPVEARESRHWVEQMMAVSGEGVPWRSGDELRAALEEEFPEMRGVAGCAPPAGVRWLGRKIPREGHRSSGRTALGPEHEMHEPRPPEDPESPLAFSMEGYAGTPPPALTARAWTPGWNSVQAAIAQQEVPGGALRGGDPGMRLIEPPSGPEPPAPFAPPDPFTPPDGQWRLVPLPHIFGSGELSALSQGIALLAPRPALLANPGDLRAAGLAEGEEVEAEVAGARVRLPVQAEASLPAGVAGVATDVPGLPWLDLPGWARIRKATP